MSIALALDTATEHVALGVAEIDPETGAAALLAEVTVFAPRRANEIALPALRDLCALARVTPGEVNVVVAGRGPGSFTGVRICLATAKGLAHGRGVPLVAVPTLDAVAWGAVAREGTLGVIGDAMRGEVYPARYLCDGTTVRRRDEEFRVGRPGDVAERWAAEADGAIALAGNGLAKYGTAFAETLAGIAVVLPEASWRPTAAGLFAAAREDIVKALADPASYGPGSALPIYTRLSDAEEAEAARAGDPVGPTPGSGVAGPGALREAGAGAPAERDPLEGESR